MFLYSEQQIFMNSKAIRPITTKATSLISYTTIVLLFINNMSIALASSSYDPDKPSNLGLNEGYVAYIYNRVYRFMNMTGDDIAEMIDNPYTPIYHEGYEGFINYHSTSTTKYFPLTMFLYNRPTFIDEKTTFMTIVQAARPLIGKKLLTIKGLEQPAKIGPLFVVDAFHIYAASIQYTPISYQSPNAYYWYNNNYHQYRSAMTMVSNYIDSIYIQSMDPIIYATESSSIVVYYMPAILGYNRYFVTSIEVGKDPSKGKTILTSGLVLSIINYDTRPGHLMNKYLILNPLSFKYNIDFYNKYKIKPPDLVILISPSAGLTEDDYNYLKKHNLVPTSGEWVSLPQLFIDDGVKAVIATRMLPDILRLKYRIIKMHNNTATMLTDTFSTFSYIANDVLVKIFEYLSKGMNVGDIVRLINTDINGADNIINYKYLSLKDYYNYLILQTNIIHEMEKYIMALYHAVENIKDIPGPETFLSLSSFWMRTLSDALDYLADEIDKEYSYALNIVEYIRNLASNWRDIISGAIVKLCEQLVIIALGIFDMFQLDILGSNEWSELVNHFMSPSYYGIIGMGDLSYSLN